MSAEWIVERTIDPRFPYRIRIEQDGRTLLAVRTQDRWPGPGGQVFCLREVDFSEDEPLEPLERVPVAHLARLGRKLAVTLDRPMRKRCEFLKIEKALHARPGTVEQIFFRTETGMRAHRTRGRVELSLPGTLRVAVDERERYPWRFPRAHVLPRRLPAGDYALLDGERLAAVVERKSLPDFLAGVGQIRGLHQHLVELSSYPHAALVVEAQYADLGSAPRIGRWPASHLFRVVGELAALHPSVPVVFAGNRKLANLWTLRFFSAVAAATAAPPPDLLREPVERFEPEPADGGLETRIRTAALEGLPDAFPIDLLRRAFPEVDDGRLRRILGRLRAEGRLLCTGKGRRARWLRTLPPAGAGDPAR